MTSAVASLLGNAEKWFSNLALAGLVVVLGLQVFFRYVLHTGLSWSEEVSRFLFVGFVYVSASYAVQKGTHIRVGLVVDWLPARWRRAAQWIADAVWVAFNALVVASGAVLVAGMIRHPVYSTSLFLPLAFVYMVIPLAHALMIVRIVQSHLPGTRAAAPADAHAGIVSDAAPPSGARPRLPPGRLRHAVRHEDRPGVRPGPRSNARSGTRS